jgi:putative membrane protein
MSAEPSAPGESAPRVDGPPDETWHELDRRSPAVAAVVAAGLTLGSAVPVFAGVRDEGRPLWQVLAVIAVAFVVVVGSAALIERVRWRHTRYRITDERVELRFSWVMHRLRSVPRDRVRTVDLTANPLLRLFGVVRVQIGTGQQGGRDNQLVLNPLDRRQAEHLRAELLTRTRPAPTDVAPDGPAAPASAPAIAELRWSWIRYAPVSVTTPILGAAAFGAVLQVADWFGLQETILGEAGELLRDLPVLALLGLVLAVGIVLGVVGSLGLFVELWWGYRLTGEHGMFRVRRGLLTRRSLSLDERRLRGVEVVEPLGARTLRAAKVDVVATGLRAAGDKERSDPKTLLPAAPIAVAHRVAARILGEQRCPTESVRLRRHPVAARRRRLLRALASTLLPAGVLALLGLSPFAVIVLVVGVPVALGLALDAYRNLGHGITGGYVVTRYGAGSRRTVALQRAGVIGWTVTSSPFQRRAGLITLAATTAAQKGAYPIRDVGADDGLRFAEEAVPGLLTPFLEPVPRSTSPES